MTESVMIHKLELKCFRKVVDDTMVFSDGLNIIRGANEISKSSRLEAISYAFFGSKGLRDSLDDVVTWGHPPKDLKVTLHYGEFTISRSKGGAEVVLDGRVHVTGQTEVTKFCEGLLGADSATATNLMLSNQMGLRGILSEGQKNTSALIEDLARFSVFDDILSAAQEKLSLGAPTIFEERLKGLKAQIEMLELPEYPDEVEFHFADDNLLVMTTGLEKQLTPAKEASLAATTAWKAEYDKRWKRDCLVQDIEKYEGQRAETVAKREAELAQTFPTNLEGLIVDLKSKVEMEANHAERVEAYRKFEAYRAPVARIDETIDKVNVRLKDNTTATSTARTHVATLRGDIKALEAQIVSASVCGFCDRDVSQFPEVAAKNERALAEIEGKRKEIAETEARIEGYKQDREVIDAILDAQQVVDRLVRSIGAYIAIDTGVTPNLVTWKGEVPTDTVSDSTPKLRAAEAQLKALHARDARVEAYDRVIAEAEGKIEKLHDEIGTLALVPDEAFEALELAHVEAMGRVTALETEIASLKAQRETAAKEFADKKAAWDRAAETEARLRGEIEQTEKDIGALAFNNALVKKVRAARPVVANSLWTMVLLSVSKIFSTMRGENSVVTKGKEGFLVNGKPASSLSGSALDLLGLSVRCSLVRMFLPNCNFLILDEPSASMDQERTNAMLGYIAASGFKQVLLVTHNPVSESFADNLIELN